MIPPRAELESAARDRDLILLGVASLDAEEAFTRFEAWLADGRHAGMSYLEKYPELRRHPEGLLPQACSALVLALPYYQGDGFLKNEIEPVVHPIAQYARFPDYHRVFSKRAEDLVRWIEARTEGGSFRVLSDTAPLLERALAAGTAEGFIGKNTLYIHPRHGSFLLLGEILTTLSFKPDARRPSRALPKTPEGGCGECRRCQVHCPTGALDEAYRIDARKCLSYWTIEHRGAIPKAFWPHVAKAVFGCDLCQLACPWNWKAKGNALPPSLKPRAFPGLFEMATLSPAQYERAFGGTPLTRAKRNGLRRNALIALAVQRDPRLPEALRQAALDPGSPVDETVAQIQENTFIPASCEFSAS